MKDWKIQIIFTTIILTCFIILLVNFSNNLSSYTKIKSNYENNLNYLNNLDFFKNKSNLLEKKIQNSPKKITDTLTPIILLNKCSAIANKLGIDILSYNPIKQLKKENDEYNKISIELNIKTDYTQLIKFINKIEKLKLISRIDQLEIYRIEPYSSGIKGKIVITGFYINEKQ